MANEVTKITGIGFAPQDNGIVNISISMSTGDTINQSWKFPETTDGNSFKYLEGLFNVLSADDAYAFINGMSDAVQVDGSVLVESGDYATESIAIESLDFKALFGNIFNGISKRLGRTSEVLSTKDSQKLRDTVNSILKDESFWDKAIQVASPVSGSGIVSVLTFDDKADGDLIASANKVYTQYKATLRQLANDTKTYHTKMLALCEKYLALDTDSATVAKFVADAKALTSTGLFKPRTIQYDANTQLNVTDGKLTYVRMRKDYRQSIKPLTIDGTKAAFKLLGEAAGDDFLHLEMDVLETMNYNPEAPNKCADAMQRLYSKYHELGDDGLSALPYLSLENYTRNLDAIYEDTMNDHPHALIKGLVNYINRSIIVKK